MEDKNEFENYAFTNISIALAYIEKFEGSNGPLNWVKQKLTKAKKIAFARELDHMDDETIEQLLEEWNKRKSGTASSKIVREMSPDQQSARGEVVRTMIKSRLKK